MATRSEDQEADPPVADLVVLSARLPAQPAGPPGRARRAADQPRQPLDSQVDLGTCGSRPAGGTRRRVPRRPVPLPPPGRVPAPPPPLPPQSVRATGVGGGSRARRRTGSRSSRCGRAPAPSPRSWRSKFPSSRHARRARRWRCGRDEVLDDPVAAAASVAEINRLASVPDLIIDDSPIELPPINPSGRPRSSPSRSSSTHPSCPKRVLVAAPRPSRRPSPRSSLTAVRHASGRPEAQEAQEEGSPVSQLRGLDAVARDVGWRRVRRPEVPPAQGRTDLVGGGGAVRHRRSYGTRPGVQERRRLSSRSRPTSTPAVWPARRSARSPAGPKRGAPWGCSTANSILRRSGSQAMNDSPAFYDPTTEDDLRQRRSDGVRTSLSLRRASCLGDGVARPAVRLELATGDGDSRRRDWR